jgi:nucleoside-diphosphate-sugar epimerase
LAPHSQAALPNPHLFVLCQRLAAAAAVQATKNVLDIAREKGASHFVLLSAICVQKPLLEFQRAKLKLEADLQVRVTPPPQL